MVKWNWILNEWAALNIFCNPEARYCGTIEMHKIYSSSVHSDWLIENSSVILSLDGILTNFKINSKILDWVLSGSWKSVFIL